MNENQLLTLHSQLLTLPMFVCKIEVRIPVELGHIVFAGADMVSDRVEDGLVDRRHLFRLANSVGSQEPIYGISILRG